MGPVEWKGIRGADNRCYVLDLVRLTPRDPNWIKEDEQDPGRGGTGVWERAKPVEGVPPLEEDFSAVIRPELLGLYVRSQVLALRQKAEETCVAKRRKEGKEKKEKKEGAGVEDGQGEDSGKEEEEATLDEEGKARLKEEEEELLERMKVNANAFLPLAGVRDREQKCRRGR
ncbi:hypothetical protein Naga_102781g1 [Nannochloropsis gaditana]|uniref:Clu domain-containing protein n=1 Tax=Nannochloropsis gaditana TaxID=72520 RepID=W7TNY0_9STRA|nr:hypothetical protein Naga_102781g1 [Nannochloropsis gaditana]